MKALVFGQRSKDVTTLLTVIFGMCFGNCRLGRKAATALGHSPFEEPFVGFQVNAELPVS